MNPAATMYQNNPNLHNLNHSFYGNPDLNSQRMRTIVNPGLEAVREMKQEDRQYPELPLTVEQNIRNTFREARDNTRPQEIIRNGKTLVWFEPVVGEAKYIEKVPETKLEKKIANDMSCLDESSVVVISLNVSQQLTQL